MTSATPRKTGLLGPVVLSAGVLLLLAAPLMRGGNRYVALIPLEFLGLAVMLGLLLRWALVRPLVETERVHTRLLLMLLVLSPMLLALVQLAPLPAQLWAQLPGHEVYMDTLKAVGASVEATRPLSLGPAATAASLLAGIPIAAALLLGYAASLSQLRVLLRAVVVLAFAEVALGLLQTAGGEHSPLYFGAMSYGVPVGSFANRNHFANYLAMALAAYLWLGYESVRAHGAERSTRSFTRRHRVALWAAGGLVLVLGILLSRSRGGAMFGLGSAALALAAVSLRLNGWSRGLRFTVPLFAVLIVGAGALIGFDAVTSRLSGDQLAASAGFRGELARTSFEGALAFWPWGSGWGTYPMVYPRFQPPSLPGFANHAHMDYVEMLFEGGIFFVMLATAFLWLAAQRAWRLARGALRERTLDREAMAAALCGLGLLGLLLHSLVDFNLRIPANAILGALLAGAYFRPLPPRRRRSYDRPSQPYSSMY
jgi:hypothetical protein